MKLFITCLLPAVLLVNFVPLSSGASLKGDATGATLLIPEIRVLPRKEVIAIRPIECKRLCPTGYWLDKDCQCVYQFVYQCPVLRCSQDCETYQLDVHGCKTCHCSPWSQDSDQDCFETITKLENTKAIILQKATVVGSLVECLYACFEDDNCVAAQYFDGKTFLNTEATCDLHYRQYQLQPAKVYEYYILNRCPSHITKPTISVTRPTIEITRPTIQQTKPTTSVLATRPLEPTCLDSTRGDSCVGVANGNYQDCYKCHGFVMCSNQLLHFQVCPAGLVWDDVVKRCEWETTTCFPRDQAPPTPTPDVQEPLGCRRSCEAHEHGQYLQSCRGCQAYAICSSGTLIDTEAMVCLGEVEWDDHHKVCVHPPSSTCRLVPVYPTRG